MGTFSRIAQLAASRLPTPGFVVGPVAYVIAIVCLGKVARVWELSQRLHSSRPLKLMLATLGQDLLLIGVVGLLMHALARLRRWSWLRLAITLLLLIPIGLLAPADVLSHRVTGRPLTFQRLRGDEGATFKDFNLLATRDLVGGVLGFAFVLLLLWLAFRFAARSRTLRRVASLRWLLALSLFGLAADLARAELLPRTLGLEEQPVFVMLGSLMERRIEGLSMSEAQWRALRQPSKSLPPPPPAPEIHGRPKNIVIFAAEGVPYKDTGFDRRFGKATRPGDDLDQQQPLPNPTPNLTRRAATHGVVFDRYYAPWHSSIQALYSIVCAGFPPLSGDIVRIKPRIDCGELSEMMKARGLRNGLFHAGQFAFYNKLALLGHRGFEIEQDAEELKKTSRRSRHQWGIDDRAMVDATLKWVDSVPREQPLMAMLIAVTAHYPYWVPKDFAKPFRGSSLHARFLNAVAFQDSVFEQLVRGFEERGRYEDTLFVWFGDHGHYVAEPERATPGLRGFYEPNLHTPLLLLNSKMFSGLPRSQRRNARLGSHIDLMPTLVDALGLPPVDARHEGQSLLSARFENRRVYFGANDGRFIGFIEGNEKFILNTRNRHFEYYDLVRDPEELTDLGATALPETMAQFSQDAMRFARGLEARFAQAPVLDENISVARIYDVFFKHVQVKSEQNGQLSTCPGGEEPDCPGLGKVLRVVTERIQGERRKCLMVRLPTQGPIELTIEGHDLVELLTGTIVAIPNTPNGRPAVRVQASADGEKPRQIVVSTQAADRPYHSKPDRELRFRLEQQPGAQEPAEVCLQLTTLVEQ